MGLANFVVSELELYNRTLDDGLSLQSMIACQSSQRFWSRRTVKAGCHSPCSALPRPIQDSLALTQLIMPPDEFLRYFRPIICRFGMILTCVLCRGSMGA